MRISDWSSDVCSSDLSRQGRQRRGAGRAVGQKRARCARALIRRCAPPSPAAQEKGWCGWRGGSDESPSPAAQEKGWFKLRGESCKPFSRLREIGRAHAELQSLMRISYAVFCLKKKKTTHTTSE